MQDEYAGGTSLESLEALVRSRMELDPSLGVGLQVGPETLSAALAPVAGSAGTLLLSSPAAATARASPQRGRLWLELGSPTGPVPMSLAGALPQLQALEISMLCAALLCHDCMSCVSR